MTSKTVAGCADPVLTSRGLGISRLSVRETARLLGVSLQRVRYLLAQGRLQGERNSVTGQWTVLYGFPLREGRRGPLMGAIVEGFLPVVKRRKRHRKDRVSPQNSRLTTVSRKGGK
jgi:hypothetical protein